MDIKEGLSVTIKSVKTLALVKRRQGFVSFLFIF